jgi:hypothetical protein
MSRPVDGTDGNQRADEEALPALGLRKRLLPVDRASGVVAMGRHHLGIELARERDDLEMRELVRRCAHKAETPLALEPQIVFLANYGDSAFN